MQRPPPHSSKKPGKAQKKKSYAQQVRSLDRLLARVTDSKQRAALEVQRAQLLGAQSEAETNQKERKLALRYHMVKFFERKRIMKAQAKLRKEIEAQGWANKEQREKLKQLDEDEEYVKHFPNSEKYVSLYAEGGDTAHAEAQRARLRALIKERLRDAAVLAERDEGGGELGDAAADAQAAFDAEEDEFFAGRGGSAPVFGDDDFGEEPAPAPRREREAAPADRGKKRPAEGVARGGDKKPRPGAKAAPRPQARPLPRQYPQLPPSRMAAPPLLPGKPKVHVVFDEGGAVKPAPPPRRPAAPSRPAEGGRPAGPSRPPPAAEPKKPLRTRAEGGRKRRPKK